jgi:carbonic anhydrase
MKIYKNILSLALLVLTIHVATAQQSPMVSRLLELKKNGYQADRDSAGMDPYYGLKKLIYGNNRFADGKSEKPRQTPKDLKAFEAGQKPFATIVGCSDSRVPNEIIFDQGVGDLFITRTAGQVMAQASYGTIEFGVEALKANLIVVLGHQSCGAVNAAMALPPNPPGHVVTLINAIKPAALRAKTKGLPEKETLNLAIKENVLEQVYLLRSLEPVLSRRVDEGTVIIVGAVYNLENGTVEFIEETITSLPKFNR